MQDKDRDLSVYRLSLAEETLANAKLCMDNQFYRDCINRSYYAAFYAIKAVTKGEMLCLEKKKLSHCSKRLTQNYQIFLRCKNQKGLKKQQKHKR